MHLAQVLCSDKMDAPALEACLDRLQQAERVGLGFIWAPTAPAPACVPVEPSARHHQQQQLEQPCGLGCGQGGLGAGPAALDPLVTSLVGVVVALDHKEAVWLHLRGKHG